MKGNGMKELKKSKSLSFKIQEATSKLVAMTEENGIHYVRQIIHITQGHLPIKSTHVIDFIDEPAIQLDVPAVKNTFF